MYKPTKRIINWGKDINFMKLLNTKVSRKWRLTLVKRDLQIINMFFNVKNTISCLSLSKKFTRTTLETLHPPPTTTNGHYEPSLLAVEPLHREERCNRSRILRVHLKDLVGKQVLNHFFRSFYEVILTSMSFS